ncbi:unnamed protein product [Arabidopsis thaliana]|uniref:(thale cress) hypothetical protein n=1 Tax=Arabidopsis thaliana TaxID=3702 RepID=A0A7G2E5K1_ARATH|nr:unnamed protein product [Arabidopsis thaliana]
MDKECPTSRDVESVHDVSKVTDPLQKAKRELDNVEIKEKQKKQKNQNETSEKETKKFSTVYEKFNDTIKELDRVSGTWPNIPSIPFTPPKEKVEPIYHNEPWLVLKAMSDACFEYHQRIKPRIVGTPHSKIGRFTVIIGRRSYS